MRAITLAIAALLLQPAGGLQPAAPTSGVELLKRVEARYATVPSYRDEGEVVTVFGGPVAHTTRKPFSTIFARGGLFRYEFTVRGDQSRYVVWAEDSCIRSWWTLTNEIESFSTIAHAIAGPTGVSGGSAHTIPALLLGTEDVGWKITRLASPVIVGTQDLPGFPGCTVVDGKHPKRPVTYRLWIDPKSLALLRIEQKSRLDGGTEVTQTTVYTPTFDAPVQPGSVRFTPPDSPSTGPDRCRATSATQTRRR